MMVRMESVVTQNPNVLGGTPVFRGTRVPVDALFDCLKHGRTVDYFMDQFPTVQRRQIESLFDELKAGATSHQVG
jgi:uncharacterized protein (DUF433 family)